MGIWKNYIEALKKEFLNKKVIFEGHVYTIVLIDYNGIIHINKTSEHNDTTAVYEPYEARKNLV